MSEAMGLIDELAGAADGDTKDFPSVALAYCHGDTVRPAFMRSVNNAISFDRGRALRATIEAEGLYVPALRNRIVEKFLGGDAEWLWFLDTDVEFPEDTLYRMLLGTRSGQRKILAASYWNYYADGNHLTWLAYEDDDFHPYAQTPDWGYVELAGCGMGCTLIHRQVFLDVREMRKDDPDPWVWFGHDLLETKRGFVRAGEDQTFCIRAREAGHVTWGSCELTVEHYKLQAQPKGNGHEPD